MSKHARSEVIIRLALKSLADWWMGNVTVCRRRTNDILQSLEIIPSCHKFISICDKIFDCLESLQPCQSTQFGTETDQGF